MKRVYSTLRPPVDQRSYVEWIAKTNQKLSVSSRGLLAFTSSFCLNQRRPSTTSYHVYVADINTPYQPYLLVDSEYEFTIVEWDPSGTKLLVCDVRGCATIYTSKDHLISDWTPFFQQGFAAETFIAAAWYHSGIVNTINVANNQSLKNPSNHLDYNEKVQQSRYGASLRLFGGKSAEGCVLVSKTGLICCLTLSADKSVDVISESLAPLRMRIEVADICHSKDGSFIVGTSAGSINSTISFFQIQLKTRSLTLDQMDSSDSIEGQKTSVICKPFYSFHLNIMAQILTERESFTTFERVSHIKFVTKDSPEDVLIEVSGKNLSLIELWELEPKKKSPVHSAIMDIKNKDDVKPNIDKPIEHGALNSVETHRDWSFKGNYITDKDLVTIQTPKFKIFGTNRQTNVILLAYRDSTICYMRKEDLQPMYETIDLSVNVSARRNGKTDISDTNSPYKVYQNRSSNLKSPMSKTEERKSRPVYITDIQLSCNQATFIAIDSISQLHCVQLPPLLTLSDPKDHETYLQYLLEYSLITGNDWWDTMACARQDSLDSICDKFHDAYERQPKYMQKKYFNRQLMMRATLYRCLNSAPSLCKASDCHTLIMLNSIASTMKSMLRSQDQDSPSENLSTFLKTQANQPNSHNCNHVISRINEKEFHVETNLIQCLQPLIQWITDLAIYLMVSTPQRVRSRTVFPGTGLIQNKEALETLRELMIIIKIWGLQNEASMPFVHRLNDSIDVIGTLYKLISICHTNSANELEDSFVEECVQFANSISIPQFTFSLEPIGVASPLIHRSKLGDSPLVMEFFKEPNMSELVSLPKVDGAINMTGKRKIDVVRNISLGAYPISNLRNCTRCKAVSLVKQAFYTNRAWEQRWINSCVCGGSWAQSDATVINKASYLAVMHHNSCLNPMRIFTQQMMGMNMLGM